MQRGGFQSAAEADIRRRVAQRPPFIAVARIVLIEASAQCRSLFLPIAHNHTTKLFMFCSSLARMSAGVKSNCARVWINSRRR